MGTENLGRSMGVSYCLSETVQYAWSDMDDIPMSDLLVSYRFQNRGELI